MSWSKLCRVVASDLSSSFIAIHGLNGDAFGTWTDKNTGFMWLQDSLPARAPNARVFSFGYGARFYKADSNAGITDWAQQLIHEYRNDTRVLNNTPFPQIAASPWPDWKLGRD